MASTVAGHRCAPPREQRTWREGHDLRARGSAARPRAGRRLGETSPKCRAHARRRQRACPFLHRNRTLGTPRLPHHAASHQPAARVADRAASRATDRMHRTWRRFCQDALPWRTPPARCQEDPPPLERVAWPLAAISAAFGPRHWPCHFNASYRRSRSQPEQSSAGLTSDRRRQAGQGMAPRAPAPLSACGGPPAGRRPGSRSRQPGL
jgi:hypothetical protein